MKFLLMEKLDLVCLEVIFRYLNISDILAIRQVSRNINAAFMKIYGKYPYLHIKFKDAPIHQYLMSSSIMSICISIMDDDINYYDTVAGNGNFFLRFVKLGGNIFKHLVAASLFVHQLAKRCINVGDVTSLSMIKLNTLSFVYGGKYKYGYKVAHYLRSCGFDTCDIKYICEN